MSRDATLRAIFMPLAWRVLHRHSAHAGRGTQGVGLSAKPKGKDQPGLAKFLEGMISNWLQVGKGALTRSL